MQLRYVILPDNRNNPINISNTICDRAMQLALAQGIVSIKFIVIIIALLSPFHCGECISYGGSSGELSWPGFEPVHVAAKLTVVAWFSLKEEQSYQCFFL
jgi:hypothetical protein